MKISDETMKTVMELGKLSLPAGQEEAVKKDLEKILAYMDRMDELDTERVEPMPYVLPLENIFREDEVEPSQDRAELLANAPEQKDGCFVVPKAVE